MLRHILECCNVSFASVDSTMFVIQENYWFCVMFSIFIANLGLSLLLWAIHAI